MKNIYKRSIAIICTVFMIIPILCLPANADYYGIRCPSSADLVYPLYKCPCRYFAGNRDELCTVVQDSRCIPENDFIAQEYQKYLDLITVEENAYLPDRVLEVRRDVYYRIFTGSVLDRFKGTDDPKEDYYASPQDIHTILVFCNNVHYVSRIWSRQKVYDDSGNYEIVEDYSDGESRMAYDLPINQWYGVDIDCSIFNDFMKDPIGELTSAEITASLKDDMDIEYIFFFNDDEAAIIYCVTNCGDYIYFSPYREYSNKERLKFVFSADMFKNMLDKAASRWQEHMGYDSFDEGWSGAMYYLKYDREFILTVHTRDEIMPHLVGGDATVERANINDTTFGYNLKPRRSTVGTETTDNGDTKTLSGEKEERIFTVLFIVETALIVVGATAALITVFVSRARKKKKQQASMTE